MGDLRFYPDKHGFDVNVGGCAAGGPPSFFSPYRIHSLPDGPKGEYLPDRLAKETISFIEKNAKKPWLLTRSAVAQNAGTVARRWPNSLSHPKQPVTSARPISTVPDGTSTQSIGAGPNGARVCRPALVA